MARRNKLSEKVLANPKKVRFGDACKIATALGFVHEGGHGSHRVFKRAGEMVQLNFQDRDGFIPPYQGRQLAAMIRKYEASE
jgi:hypothetical protein